MKQSMIKQDLIEARDEYINEIKTELMGPGSEFSYPDAEHELISSSPSARYSVGILYPRSIDGIEGEETAEEEEVATTDDNDGEKQEIKTSVPKVQEYDSDDWDEDDFDSEISTVSKYKPSSMGMTFLVQGNIDNIFIDVKFATYRHAKITDCVIPVSSMEFFQDKLDTYQVPGVLSHKMYYDKDTRTIRLNSAIIDLKEIREIFERDVIHEDEAPILKKIAYKFHDYCVHGYVREPHYFRDIKLDFTDSMNATGEPKEELASLNVVVKARCIDLGNNIYSITVMLVNTYETTENCPDKCLYQAQLIVDNHDNDRNAFCFVDKNAFNSFEGLDDEELNLAMLYREKKIYATGLGTATDWRINSDGIGSIWNDFMPSKEIPSMKFSLDENELLKDQELSMKYLSDLDDTAKAKKCQSLENLVVLYKNWVDSLEVKQKELDQCFQTMAARNIALCKNAYVRMFRGINILKSNKVAFDAFQLANRAMFMQRVHLRMQAALANKDRYNGDKDLEERLESMDYYEESDKNCCWRPFQLAFMLLDIESIVDSHSQDRDLVDLIWFPTGGGKTEAYLGLTAFTIFYRRMAFPDVGGGTAVMMRYTLRLLTAQQFTRAATLICACEFIRGDGQRKNPFYPKYDLGIEPITIGLWIGGAHIPNTINEARDTLEDLTKSTTPSGLEYLKERYNKFQVLKCPWCGAKLVKDVVDGKIVGDWGYALKGKRHFYLHCTEESCHYNDKLPIQIIDEELYANPPTLLFGTVDKFAMLPWRNEIGSFFGVATKYKAPDLIIQDELHLISGALGTIVGLYETAIDELCGLKGIKTKIIASTATIRRAQEQCASLYNRQVVQFPPPGIDAGDSYFAREESIDYKKGVYGRRYIGFMPAGKSRARVEAKAMASLAQTSLDMQLDESLKDNLWTITVYFNSLREIGKAGTLVNDDVKDDVLRISRRKFRMGRLLYSADELTSRVNTTALNKTLDKLEKVKYSLENRANKKYATDILLATNMISVGIDVKRLNVMLMEGQPKLTSEYIQASSRVGRTYPGVVFVQYDATKSRDRSHFEQFKQYHESFYRFVEPTGVTPFSKPALERALHAVFIAVVRNKAAMVKDEDAIMFDMGETELRDTVKNIRIQIVDRIKTIHKRVQGNTQFDQRIIDNILDELCDRWQILAQYARDNNTGFYFGRRFLYKPSSSNNDRLLKPFYPLKEDAAFPTLTSMRNVSPSVLGEIIIEED